MNRRSMLAAVCAFFGGILTMWREALGGHMPSFHLRNAIAGHRLFYVEVTLWVSDSNARLDRYSRHVAFDPSRSTVSQHNVLKIHLDFDEALTVDTGDTLRSDMVIEKLKKHHIDIPESCEFVSFVNGPEPYTTFCSGESGVRVFVDNFFRFRDAVAKVTASVIPSPAAEFHEAIRSLYERA